jgi:pentatricopeptide repeat protein
MTPTSAALSHPVRVHLQEERRLNFGSAIGVAGPDSTTPRGGSPRSGEDLGEQTLSLENVPSALLQASLHQEQGPEHTTKPLTTPSIQFVPIPLTGPLPWEAAYQSLSNLIVGDIIPHVADFSELISLCGKAGRADVALEVFDLMKKIKVSPNMYTINALIAACVNNGTFDSLRSILLDAVEYGVYKHTLGYDSVNNTLNFHIYAVVANATCPGSETGVPLPVAWALFRHHLNERNQSNEPNIKPGTLLIVGQHGEDLIKNAVKQWIRNLHGCAVEWQRDGRTNPGALRWVLPRNTRRALKAQQALQTNPKVRAVPLLNRNAPEFVPSNARAPLNPNAPAFVPGQPQ